MKNVSLKIALACFLICIFSQSASGSGFDSSIISAYSFSQGNAVAAHSNDASTIFFNPALMNKLEQSQIKLSNNIIFTSGEFRSNATGKKYDREDATHYMPSLFAVHKINDNLAAGLGVYTNFGLSTEWDDDWEGRYLATKSELTTYTVNPSLSVKVASNIYLGGGLDILTLDADLRKHINLSYFQLPDIKQKMTGDDVGVGYNLGLLIDLTEDISFGASYRSEIKAKVDGKIKHRITSDVPPELAAMFPNTKASTEVTMPAQAFVGIAYKKIKPFIFEITWKWIESSSYDELRIKLNKPIAGSTEIVIPKNWRDTYYISFGTQYQASDNVTLNAGYIFDRHAVPDATYEPAVPDSDAHVFCIGTDIKYKDFTIGLLYTFKKYDDREKNNSVDCNSNDCVINPITSANGKYKNSLHAIGIDITYRF